MELLSLLLLLAATVMVGYRSWDRRRLLRRVESLQAVVFTDELTRIGNRRRFNDVLTSATAHALRSSEPLVVVLVDVNDFKGPNDRFGHPFGDRMLRRIAECLGAQLRPSDTACRIGGDEFALVLVDCDLAGARKVVSRIARRLAESTLSCDGERVPLRASFGGTDLRARDGRAFVAGIEVGSVRDPDVRAKVERLVYEEADKRLFDAKARKQNEPYPESIS